MVELTDTKPENLLFLFKLQMIFADAKGILKSLTLTSVKMKKGGGKEGEFHETLYVKFLPKANIHSYVIKP